MGERAWVSERCDVCVLWTSVTYMHALGPNDGRIV